MAQQLIFTNDPGECLDKVVSSLKPAGVYVITDSNAAAKVLPVLIEMSSAVRNAEVIEVQAGDINKDLDALKAIWSHLNKTGATRKSLIINIGGGMVTDMGGFAAATFKRGVRFVNVPTTLLGAVDASVGGKTGINFNGCKNEIGVFAEAEAVIISTEFFKTLPEKEILSGYAEMLKHGLLENRAEFSALLNYNIKDNRFGGDHLLELLKSSVSTKARVVSEDPHEHGIRRALNLGHTVGHAIESFAMNRRNTPGPHGYAVAWGIVVELVLSNIIEKFPSDILQAYTSYIRDNYGAFYITCDDYPELLELMAHDKKNSSPDSINFTLLSDVGDIKIDCIVDNETIVAALDIYRDLMGI